MQKTRELIEQALQHPSGSPRPGGCCFSSTGSSVLDQLIGGKDRPDGGYPQGKIFQVGIEPHHFEGLRETLVGMYRGPIVRVETATPPDVESSIAKVWTAISTPLSKSCLIVVDNIRLGTSGQNATNLAGMMNQILPRLKMKLAETGNTLLGFAQIQETPNPGLYGPPYNWEGGKGWKFYSAVRMRMVPSEVVKGAFAVHLDKCKVAPTQNNVADLIIRDGVIDDAVSTIRG